MRRIVMFIACALGACCALAAPAHQKSSSALVQYLRKGGLDLRAGSYFIRNITAPGKSPTLVLVYSEASGWCGSSGCSLTVVDTSGPRPRAVADFNAWTPITSDGWSSGYEIIGVWHHGGGVMKPYCDELRFRADGSEYANENEHERALEQKRCASSKKVLLKKDWH